MNASVVVFRQPHYYKVVESSLGQRQHKLSNNAIEIKKISNLEESDPLPIRKRYQHESVEGARVGRLNFGINTTFIVYRIGQTLIDTGPSNQWAAVSSFISERPVTTILLSHHHEDHSGNAQRIADKYQLLPYAPTQKQAKLTSGYRTPWLQRLIWGKPQPVQTQPLPLSMQLPDGLHVQAIHTPGHAKDLHCFYLPEQRWLFSGDLYISKSLRYLRTDENLQQLMDSIALVLKLDFDILFCPHRGIIVDGKRALQDKLSNIIAICQKSQQLGQQGLSFASIVNELLGPEDMMSHFTNFNFSKANFIKQALTVDMEKYHAYLN